MENTRRRSSYRRTSTTRRGRTPQKTNSDSFKEKILMQCIISGVIFLFVLVINLVNTDFTVNLKKSLKSAVATSVTFDDLKLGADGASNYFAVVEETVKTIFGYEKETETEKNVTTEEISLETPTAKTDIDDSDFRIDEDILKKMNETPKKP